MKETPRNISRRKALGLAASAFAAPMIVPASVLGKGGGTAPSNRITIGAIGMGARGFANLDGFFKCDDAQVVAVCDVDTFHYREYATRTGRPLGLEPGKLKVETTYADRKGGSGDYKGCNTYEDYHELCARDDIDAVLVATPDHWHALMTLEALRQGKDVYCEKPVTHHFHEGQQVVAEVAAREAVFQTGSQQRSTANFRQAVELVLNGHLGKIQKVEVGLPAGYPEPQASTEVLPIPDHLNYDFWCGPSPVLPYMRATHHRFWRGVRAYGGGNLMDWIGHHNDIAHWGLGMDGSGPLEVEATGWTSPKGGIYDTPVDFTVRCQYAGDIETTISTQNRGGTKWIGENGWVWVNRGALEASNPEWIAPEFDRGGTKAYESPDHHRNFLDCVKSRKPCVAPAETGHRSITPGHLGFVSNTLGRKLKWDAAKEQIVGDEEAQKLLMAVPYRDGWAS